ERRRLSEPPDIVDIETHVNEAAIAAPREADLPHMSDGAVIETADLLAIDRRVGSEVERGAAQRVERRKRAVDVHGRTPVERQVDVLFVLVLPEQSAGAASDRRRHNP